MNRYCDSDPSTTSTSSYDLSSESDDELKTPKKKKYKRSIHHGVSKSRAFYHKVAGETRTSKPRISFVSSARVANDIPKRPSVHKKTSNEQDRYAQTPVEIAEESSSTTEKELSSIYDTSSDTSMECILETSSSESNEYFYENLTSESEVETTEKNEPLYENSRHTIYSSYTMIMLFVMKHSLSRDAFSDLLMLISSHLPRSATFTTSVYKIKETLKKCTEFQEPQIHKYCGSCQQYLGNEDSCTNTVCERSQSNVENFYDLNVLDQLKAFFQEKDFVSLIRKSQPQTKNGCIADIVNGSFYQEVLQRNKNSSANADVFLTFIMNTDGVSLFSSKKGSLWPVYLAINELPIKIRFSKKYILPCMLHCEVEKPNMLTYLSPLMKTLQQLYETGLEVKTPLGKLLVKAQLIAVCTDLPARAMVLNMKQFNGKYGCSMCLDEGSCPPGKPLLRFYPFNKASTARTHQSMLDDAKEACRKGDAVNGIKGASALMALNYADLPKFFVIDWMHSVLLGVTKALLSLWLNSEHKDQDFFIGNKKALLNRRLLKIQVPDFIQRRQRSLDEYAHWKASEFREWLIHYSVPVLSGILPSYPFVHFLLLTTALSLLTKEDLTLDDVNYAEQLLLDFCAIYPSIYGVSAQTMNIHLLRHLANFTRLYGPLFCFSCFGFESMNSFVKKMVHGTRYINHQISFAVMMSRQLVTLLKQWTDQGVDPTIRNLANHLGSKFLIEDKIHSSTENSEVTPLGKVKPVENSNESFALLTLEMKRHHPYMFVRLKKGNTIFYGSNYKQSRTRNSCTVAFHDDTGEKYGTIIHFIKVGMKIFVFLQECETVPFTIDATTRRALQKTSLEKYTYKTLCPFVVKVSKKFGMHKLVDFDYIVQKCVFVDIGENLTFITKPPNLLEHG